MNKKVPPPNETTPNGGKKKSLVDSKSKYRMNATLQSTEPIIIPNFELFIENHSVIFMFPNLSLSDTDLLMEIILIKVEFLRNFDRNRGMIGRIDLDMG
jgi:hypothetical protein